MPMNVGAAGNAGAAGSILSKPPSILPSTAGTAQSLLSAPLTKAPGQLGPAPAADTMAGMVQSLMQVVQMLCKVVEGMRGGAGNAGAASLAKPATPVPGAASALALTPGGAGNAGGALGAPLGAAQAVGGAGSALCPVTGVPLASSPVGAAPAGVAGMAALGSPLAGAAGPQTVIPTISPIMGVQPSLGSGLTGIGQSPFNMTALASAGLGGLGGVPGLQVNFNAPLPGLSPGVPLSMAGLTTPTALPTAQPVPQPVVAAPAQAALNLNVPPATTGNLDSAAKLQQEIQNFWSQNRTAFGSAQGNAGLAQFLTRRFPETQFIPQGVNGQDLFYPLNGRNLIVDASGNTPPRVV